MFDELEKGLAEKFENQLRLIIGDLYKKFDERINGLSELHRTKKGRKVITFFPQAFVNTFVQDLYEYLFRLTTLDLQAVYDFLEYVEKQIILEVNNHLGFALPVLAVKPMSQKKILTMLDSAVRISKTYRGELPAYNFMQLFNSARGGIMIITTLIATISMFLPDVRKNLGFYIAPVMGVALVWGIIDTYQTIRSEKEELNNKDLERAKDHFRAELERILSAFQQEWGNKIKYLLQQHKIEYTNALLKNLQDYSKVTQETIQEHRQKFQIQVQKTDMDESRLLNILTNLNQQLSSIAQQTSDLRYFLLTTFTNVFVTKV